MKRQIRITSEVIRKIGYYVYVYVDPRNRRIFYVGKGCGARALAHLAVKGRSPKAALLSQIRRAGFTPQIDVIAHGLPSEKMALQMEAALIDALGLKRLVNKIKAGTAKKFGRLPLRKLVASFRAKEAIPQEPVIIVRISRLYSFGMSKQALYEATRGVWRVNRKRVERAKYALATYEGIVCEVYKIDKWERAGTKKYKTRPVSEVRKPGRWEFIGKPASASIRDRYVEHHVRRYLPRGLQAPIVYVNC